MPVAFGYIPLGMAFGVLFQGLGYAWFFAPLTGIFIYAGSAQFMAVTLLASGAGLVEAFTATLLLNLRHVFYGLSLLDRYKALGKPSGDSARIGVQTGDRAQKNDSKNKRRFDFGRFYAIFGLTDETFSIVSALPRHERNDRQFIIGLTLINQVWWVIGCSLGALLGLFLGAEKGFNTAGLEFSLTALFAVLLVDQVKRTKAILPLVAAAIAAVLCLTAVAMGWLPQRLLLISAIGISCMFMVFAKDTGLEA